MNQIKYLISIHLCIIIILNTTLTIAQVNFEQKQRITINENSGPLLSIKNNDSQAFSELSIENNISKSFSIGVSGNSNTFFNNFTSTPYLFNSSGNDFHFRSGQNEEFKFYSGSTQIGSFNNLGLVMNSGKSLLLQSSSGNDLTALLTSDLGNFHILANGNQGDTVFTIEDSFNHIGINTSNPLSELHLKQNGLPVTNTLGAQVSSFEGVRINDWNIYENASNQLCFVYKGIFVGYIDDNSGSYVNFSDRRLKENISPIESVLDLIKQLKPKSYNYIHSNQKTIGFIAQEVEDVFPELIHQGNNHKALAYDNFAVLAIKGTQELIEKMEQQATMVEKLDRENSELRILLDQLNNRINRLEPSFKY